MVISFFGHSSFCGRAEYKQAVMNLLESVIGEDKVDFYLGGYGGFDSFVYDVIIVYISREFGGAYRAYSYAIKKNKIIHNIFKKDFSKIT